jgi:hypothetical protein
VREASGRGHAVQAAPAASGHGRAGRVALRARGARHNAGPVSVYGGDRVSSLRAAFTLS